MHSVAVRPWTGYRGPGRWRTSKGLPMVAGSYLETQGWSCAEAPTRGLDVCHLCVPSHAGPTRRLGITNRTTAAIATFSGHTPILNSTFWRCCFGAKYLLWIPQSSFFLYMHTSQYMLICISLLLLKQSNEPKTHWDSIGKRVYLVKVVVEEDGNGSVKPTTIPGFLILEKDAPTSDEEDAAWFVSHQAGRWINFEIEVKSVSLHLVFWLHSISLVLIPRRSHFQI